MNRDSQSSHGSKPAQDRAALGRAIASCSTYLMMVAGRLKGRHLQTQEGISDLVQRTLVNALETIREGRTVLPTGTDEELRAWLVGVLKNTYREMVRHYKTKKRDPIALPPRPRGPSPSSEAIWNEEVARRTKALESLEPLDREILRWRDDEELTFEEIGRRRGYSTSYACRAYRKARARFEQAWRGDVRRDSP